MKRIPKATTASLAVSAGLIAGATFLATPAHADPGADAFVGALSSAGLGGIDPATAVSVGQSVCPMLSEPGQQMADVAAGVSDALGRPLGPATMFTGIAISMFCPAAVTSLANGQNPIPFGLAGF
ncbi:hypothetical protein MARA_55690 [Mycolicibacterium arabiense]|uniref:DUF732 domain-containing protein n=1 Tax=Mycolicibacterium arabiense TaxID=1286181 RepID=A0A7I7S6U7_9MYCO|nr:DUF732 domain-containing protein [Mycolicibacterium arabiense]MCV7372725.1 DUF732 domain-containing protein [Mycolicibacterium arabiense]BBY52101.1 hypothetical protein MARA_55690 [Mycolicibacterium arabiense]